MTFPVTAQLEFINQIPLDTVDTPGSLARRSPSMAHPELAGCKVRIRGTTPIYVVDSKGHRRLVPFPLTFMNLFNDSAVLQVLVCSSVSDITEGPALDDGAVLLRGRSSERIYLLDHGKKRLITSQRVMEKYEFSEESAVVVPQILIDAVPDGEVWE
ncbi:MAG TPA: hypothetical protein VKY85_21100 [Candidatus Angelobacter sp.]|nr:hypothetical protein [Candidatus Angelobacter sp.]